MPIHTGSVEAFLSAFELRRFNERVIVALFNPQVLFVRSNWKAMGPYHFDS